MRYNIGTFALLKRLFCTAKAPILQRKTAAFAMPNNCFRFLHVFSLQSKGGIYSFLLCFFCMLCAVLVVCRR